jgi:alpha-galactosidase
MVPRTTALAFLLAAAGAHAVTPQPVEFDTCRRWVERVFGGAEKTATPTCLKVLHEDVADAMTRGKSWRGTPYMLGGKTYTHGIAFNSTKHILVRLGRPAERFTADVGLENNDDTQRGAKVGCGSITFHVLVGGKEVFTSPVRRLRDGALPLNVPLNGAEEFEVRVKDGGDGRGWDQALWAEAVVALRDGSRVRLQDLPWADDVEENPRGFSFVFKGAPSATLLGQWKRERFGVPALAGSASSPTIHAPAKAGTPNPAPLARCGVTHSDAAGGLEVRVEVEMFADFPAVEWVVHFKNTGKTDTPLLENIQALDATLPVTGAGQATLHWARGAVASFDDFAPQTTALKAGAKHRLDSGGGRSSSAVLPFFNVEGAGGGVVAAIGWSGSWAAEFACSRRGGVAMKAGMSRTRLVLHPGESIRTPRMMLLFYEGDRWRGQNLLRQFLLAHHRPQPNGKPLVAPITCGNWGGTRADIHLDNIRLIHEQRLPVDYYWIDAEWYGAGGWATNVGNWAVKRDLYPAGFKPLSDALRRNGRELLLWFEPERVFKNTLWHREHRDWLFDIKRDSLLWNLGNPAARKFLTDFISSRIEEFGLGCYRQDFNFDPLPYWQAADAPDRQGISEIRHIEGLYAFWDELLARHPGLIIDNCASGGRRIDLETTGRATPLWRTDGPRDPIAHQCHTLGLLAWVPLSATSQDLAGDDYEFRSSMCSALCLNWWVSGDAPAGTIRADFPFAWGRKTLAQYRELRKFFYGDYYPLTSHSQARDVWMSYQLDRPDLGAGLVVALRRPESPYHTARFPLRGLDGNATYQITNLDTGERSARPGRDLSREGLEVAVNALPGSALLVYERK